MPEHAMVMKVIMPSEGDMELCNQEGGTVNLSPLFYGNESMGPHIVIEDGGKVLGRYKLKLKLDGKVELKKGL